MNKSILLRCPKCKQEMMTKREDYDYTDAARVEITCPECNAGDFGEPSYYDADGKHINRDCDELNGTV